MHTNNDSSAIIIHTKLICAYKCNIQIMKYTVKHLLKVFNKT